MSTKKKVKVAKKDTVLVLRTCDEKLKSYGGFQWPESGKVECPDWKEEARCGNGLHGLLWGEGEGSLLSWDAAAKWLVVEVPADSVVAIDSAKVKFPAGKVVHCGDRFSATEYIKQFAPNGKTIVGVSATAGDGGTATAGYGGTATAGDGGTATAGYGGTATAGDGGTATAGYRGTATAGYGGILSMLWWDEKAERYRKAVGYIGEDGLEPKVPYVVENGKIVKKGEVMNSDILRDILLSGLPQSSSTANIFDIADQSTGIAPATDRPAVGDDGGEGVKSVALSAETFTHSLLQKDSRPTLIECVLMCLEGYPEKGKLTCN